MFRYHVTYDVQKQIIEMNSKENNEFMVSLKTAFNISLLENIILQQWDADFEDWVTVTNTEHLPDKCKLFIIIRGLLWFLFISIEIL